MKTSKRERIILGLMVLAILYGGSVFLFSNAGKKNSGSDRGDTATYDLIMEIAQDMSRYNLTDVEQMVLEKAQIPWSDQPFVAAKTTSDEKQSPVNANSEASSPDGFSFTGYLEVGNRRLAIINGEEYETGDQLTKSSFVVREISPGQVLLGGESNGLLTVPLLENAVQNAPLIME